MWEENKRKNWTEQPIIFLHPVKKNFKTKNWKLLTTNPVFQRKKNAAAFSDNFQKNLKKTLVLGNICFFLMSLILSLKILPASRHKLFCMKSQFSYLNKSFNLCSLKKKKILKIAALNLVTLPQLIA